MSVKSLIGFEKIKDNNFIDNTGNFNMKFNSGTVTTTEDKFGKKAARISGGRYIYSNQSPDFSNNDFTVDFWVKFYSLLSRGSLLSTCKRYDADSLTLIQNGTSLRVLYNTVEHVAEGGSDWRYYTDSPTNFKTNTWTHLAIVRHDGALNIYADGHLVKSIDNIGSEKICFYKNTPMIIGEYPGFSGYSSNIAIDNFRISNYARWLTDFTPPNSFYSQVYLSTTGGRCTV